MNRHSRGHLNHGRRIISSMLEKIDTAKALSIWIGLKHNELVVPNVDPFSYLDADSYLIDAQAIALVKKNPWILSTSESANARALEKAIQAEQTCYETNIAFSSILKDFQKRSILESARHYVERILGDFSWADPDFGPGASFALKGELANIVTKLRTLPECTPLAHDLVFELILTQMPLYAVSSGMITREKGSVQLATRHLPIVHSNRFTFVPKTSTESRGICVEPLGNLLAQKAIGSKIRSRLKRWGLDLGIGFDGNERQLIHRNLARESSINGLNATIDLSAASDTVSIELVRFLLPQDWFDVIRRTRSTHTLMPDNSVICNEKISSMGNGFTFELETLIFYALGLAIRYHYGNRSDIVSIYGDDIICSAKTAEKLVTILQDVGFTTNREKTFLSGPFRESCGGDYFNGTDVRPIFFKDMNYENSTIFFITLANRIRAVARMRCNDIGCDDLFRGIWNDVIHHVPKHYRVFGPLELGDDVINSEPERWRSQSTGYTRSVQRLVRVSRNREVPRGTDHELACALYGIREEGVTKRGSSFVLRKRYTTGVFDSSGNGSSWL